MINVNQLIKYVIIPTLKHLDPDIPYSDTAVDLLVMTCAHESLGGKYLHQINGPARGIYQMEPNTEDDIDHNFLNFRPKLENKVDSTRGGFVDGEMMYNLAYATAMARVHYWRVSESLPDPLNAGYIDALGEYAKKHYNTHKGKATAKAYVRDYFAYIAFNNNENF
jgi:hypothetical protein